jgi:hypothetical protein
MRWLSGLALVLGVTIGAQGAGGALRMKVMEVRLRGLDATERAAVFNCTVDYDKGECVRDALTLAETLKAYPVDRLGEWQFVIASRESWAKIVRELGGDPGSPAFTVMDARVMVFEQTLFSATVMERAELLKHFGVATDRMLDYAVSHELGHALCGEHSERRAERIGMELRAGGTGRCGVEQIQSRNTAGGFAGR